MRPIALAASAALTMACPLAAQVADTSEAPLLLLGGGLAAQYNMHSASFGSLPGVPSCCPSYESGNGISMLLAAQAELPLSKQLAARLRVGYSAFSGTLRRSEPIPLFDVIGDDVSRASVEHSIESSLGSVVVEPLAVWRPLASMPLVLTGGFSMAFLTSSDFAQKEVLTTPVNATFADGSVVRNQYSGSIPGVRNSRLGLVMGVGYELPMGTNLTLAPAIEFTPALTGVAESVSWSVHSLRVGASVHYALRSAPEAPAPPPPPPPPPVEPPPPEPAKPAVLASALDVEGFVAGKSIGANPSVVVNETETRFMVPLLQSIYFPKGEGSLSRTRMLRYNRADDTLGFSYELLPEDPLEFYKHTLNIIGKRMNEYPRASVTLTGIINTLGDESTPERLARQRAEDVKAYLESTWGVDPRRLRITTKVVSRSSSYAAADVVEENQTVELSSSTWQLFEPIIVQKNVRTVWPEELAIRPVLTSSRGIERWNIEASAGRQTIYADRGRDIPTARKLTLSPAAIPDDAKELRVRLDAVDAGGAATDAEQVLSAEVNTVRSKRSEGLQDVEIDKYSLVLFEFDNASLDDRNSRVLQIIKSRLKPTSTIIVRGYADRTGSADYNRQLASGRSTEVAERLKNFFPADRIRVEAIGSDELLYDNTLPEGRSYSRTVQIIVETPVEK